MFSAILADALGAGRTAVGAYGTRSHG